ncbi:telomere-associated RecQ helicase [Metarhizium rileyi]|uniref:Telomere-associated RecQ helicase n=1 Tax=Metarhizium rileyi (strain RCEF 4871) TaxID=1649241 RepID=A0A166YL28_METRR|nr:telomere-associated RecQ helicase [Metarhizium rileyi RCEF 4871]
MARKSWWEAMLKGRDWELLSAMIEIPWLQGGQSHVLVRRDPDCQEDDVYWDSDGQQTSGARTSAVVSRDFINLSLDEEVDRIDHTNDYGGDEENDGETDDETNDRGDFEGEYDSDDDCDRSAYAGSGYCEVDSNVAAGTQSDDACISAFHATNA